jgi:hypothetical protein
MAPHNDADWLMSELDERAILQGEVGWMEDCFGG